MIMRCLCGIVVLGGDIVVFLVYLVWDIVADFKIVGVKKNGICMC
jgi:hypothetical protein